MKLPLDLKIYAALVIVGSVWSLLSVHPTIVLTPLGVFATVGRCAYTYALVMQLMFPLWAILIILKSPAGWYLAFCHRLYGVITLVVTLTVNFRVVSGTSQSIVESIEIPGSKASYYAQELLLPSLVGSLAIAFAEVIYLLWRRKRFFAICRATKSAKSSKAEGPEA